MAAQFPTGCPMASLWGSRTSIVSQHAQYFAETDGKLTDNSMRSGHSKQNIHDGVDLKMKAIRHMLRDNGVEATSQNLSGSKNPASSGIWNEDGTFNPTRFSQLAAKSVKSIDGKDVITEKIFLQFLEEIHKGKDYGKATTVFKFIPVTWKRVTEGSINELFKYYSDAVVVPASGKNEPAMTVSKLRKFYTNPNSVMDERVRAVALTLR